MTHAHAAAPGARPALPLGNRIDFSDEQAMLLDTAEAFCRERSPISAVRARLGTQPGHDPSVWRQMTELGWCGLAVPEALGGSGLGLAELATLVEPMGRHLMATPFISAQLAVQALLAGNDPGLQQTWLPRLAQGAVGTVALFEDDGDWNLMAPACTAQAQGGQLRLAGRKTLVADAIGADLVLVSVLLDGEPALVALSAADLPAERLHPEIVIDETRRCAAIALDGLVVPAAAALTGEAARAALEAIRRAALLLLSAEAAGGLAGALALVVDYLNLRTAFGRKIGSYQSLKHACADMLVGLERARSHVRHAASLLAAGEDAEIALRMAKVEAGDSFVFAGDRAVQFHGGFGFTWECDAQLYLRRALWLQAAFGDAAHHRRHLADLLLGPLSRAA
jgi:alkylation response protein AidB-like acyl-CoA dehydrogenase